MAALYYSLAYGNYRHDIFIYRVPMQQESTQFYYSLTFQITVNTYFAFESI